MNEVNIEYDQVAKTYTVFVNHKPITTAKTLMAISKKLLAYCKGQGI